MDQTGSRWARNPSQSGYSIPLILIGGNQRFFPDFVAWGKKDVFLIDTKATFLLQDMRNKLVKLVQAAGRPNVHIRFVVDGKLDSFGASVSTDGFTVVGFKPDQSVKYRRVPDLSSAALTAIGTSI